MRFYDKFYKNCYEELLTYYPDFYRNVYEMNEILKAFGELSDGLEKDIEEIFENCFIDTADEKVIAFFERVIGIYPDEKKSIEERRRLIKSHLLGTGKISASLICEMIRAVTGAEIICNFDNALKLEIDIDRGENKALNFNDIYELLAKKIPAHIKFSPVIVYQKNTIVISHKLETGRSKYPLCGLYFSGEKNLF